MPKQPACLVSAPSQAQEVVWRSMVTCITYNLLTKFTKFSWWRGIRKDGL